jgi:outer membrane protein assembly factor BamB
MTLENGKLAWTRDGLELFPFVRSGNTLILGSEATVVAIDMPTGNERWSRSLASGATVAANGTMHDGKLLLPMTDNTILKFDIQTGNQTTSMASGRKLGHLFSIDGDLYSLTQSDLDKLSLPPNASPDKAEP